MFDDHSSSDPPRKKTMEKDSSSPKEDLASTSVHRKSPSLSLLIEAAQSKAERTRMENPPVIEGTGDHAKEAASADQAGTAKSSKEALSILATAAFNPSTSTSSGSSPPKEVQQPAAAASEGTKAPSVKLAGKKSPATKKSPPKKGKATATAPPKTKVKAKEDKKRKAAMLKTAKSMSDDPLVQLSVVRAMQQQHTLPPQITAASSSKASTASRRKKKQPAKPKKKKAVVRKPAAKPRRQTAQLPAVPANPLMQANMGHQALLNPLQSFLQNMQRQNNATQQDASMQMPNNFANQAVLQNFLGGTANPGLPVQHRPLPMQQNAMLQQQQQQQGNNNPQGRSVEELFATALPLLQLLTGQQQGQQANMAGVPVDPSQAQNPLLMLRMLGLQQVMEELTKNNNNNIGEAVPGVEPSLVHSATAAVSPLSGPPAEANKDSGETICIPCRARGMPSDHNFETGHFIVPKNVTHGHELVCSYPACRNSGVKFRFCLFCHIPVAKRNFRLRHAHEDMMMCRPIPPKVQQPAVPTTICVNSAASNFHSMEPRSDPIASMQQAETLVRHEVQNSVARSGPSSSKHARSGTADNEPSKKKRKRKSSRKEKEPEFSPVPSTIRFSSDRAQPDPSNMTAVSTVAQTDATATKKTSKKKGKKSSKKSKKKAKRSSSSKHKKSKKRDGQTRTRRVRRRKKILNPKRLTNWSQLLASRPSQDDEEKMSRWLMLVMAVSDLKAPLPDDLMSSPSSLSLEGLEDTRNAQGSENGNGSAETETLATDQGKKGENYDSATSELSSENGFRNTKTMDHQLEA